MKNNIDSEQRKKAFEIVKTVSLLLEESERDFLQFVERDSSYDLEIYDREYKIKRQATEKENDYWILIESKVRNMRIELKNNEIIFAMGITQEDLEYWQQREKELIDVS